MVYVIDNVANKKYCNTFDKIIWKLKLEIVLHEV